jgi:uncharacterized protein YkwD
MIQNTKPLLLIMSLLWMPALVLAVERTPPSDPEPEILEEQDHEFEEGFVWQVEDYQRYSLDEFLALPALQETIDVQNIDYPLLHAAIFYLTNAERITRNVPPLEHHPSLELAAHGHSRAMVDRRFFSHTSPVPGHRQPRDRMIAAGFVGTRFGENIAKSHALQLIPGRGLFHPGQTGGHFSYSIRGEPIPHHTYLSQAQRIVTQWMNSSGHRQNILRSAYTHLGVGVYHFQDAQFFNMDGFYSTQKFGTQ